jgi:ferredoxin/flavodoxin---NADP+ reductase
MKTHDFRIPARLKSRIELSDGLAIFRFSLESDFIFSPGQYATLWLIHKGKTVARPYSVTSSPSGRRVLEFYINRVREGQLTPSLWEPGVIRGLRRSDSGTKAIITGPRGRFLLKSHDLRDYIFVASGSGLAPFMSMIRKLNEDFLSTPGRFRARKIYLIHGVSCPAHLGYRAELEALAAETMKNPRRKLALVYIPTISRPFMDPSWTGLKGRAESLFDLGAKGKSRLLNHETAIRAMLGVLLNPKTHAVYVSGYPGTIDCMTKALAPRGYRIDADLFCEQYYRL